MPKDGKIRDKAEKVLSPRSWFDGSKLVTKAFIDEILGRLYGIRGDLSNGLFSLTGLLKRIHSIVETHLGNGGQIIILLIDDSTNPPKQKKAEQERRKETSEIKGYEKPGELQIDLHRDGIYNKTTDSVEAIDINKLVRTYQLMRQLWLAYIDMAKSQIVGRGFLKDDQLIVVDCFKEGPYLINNYECRQAPEHFHNHGEADVSILYWCWVFRELDMTIRTSDQDTIPILYSYIQQIPSEWLNPKIIWCYQDKTDEAKGKGIFKYVNMRRCCQEVLKGEQLTSYQFMLGFILSGNDFVTPEVKKMITRGFGMKPIFQAIWYVSKGVNFISPKDREKMKEEQWRWLDYFVRQLLTLKLTNRKFITEDTRDPDKIYSCLPSSRSLLEIELEKKKSLYLPSEKEIQEVHKLIDFNVNYWGYDWRKYTIDREWLPRVEDLKGPKIHVATEMSSSKKVQFHSTEQIKSSFISDTWEQID